MFALSHSLLFSFFVLGLLTLSGAAASEKVPDKLVFESKLGNVTFDHAKHVERENAACTACHPKPFPQSRDPINFKKGMHKPAEAQKASCASCHVAGGKSFASKGNCKKCHVRK